MANIAKGKMKMRKIPERLLPEIRYALEKDSGFDFKWNGNNLRFGICPNCGERECFINLDQLYRVSCGRLNNCGWNATVRELYPDICNNLSRRYPATEENPNATADAYLVENRGFSIESIKGMYTQGNVKNARAGEFYPSIKVIINQTCYWQRIIDAEDVRKNGAKTKIVGDYKDFGWIPPGMTFGSDDEVWITEGIFKSISLLHVGKKSMASLSASSLPRRVIADHAGKNITWVIALDNDKIGNENTKKYMEESRKLGERVKAEFPEAGGKDWDDIFREGKLNDSYLSDSVWRGFYLLSDTPSRRAFFHYCRTQKSHHVFDFNRNLYSYEINAKEKAVEENKINYPVDGKWNASFAIIDNAFAAFCRSKTSVRAYQSFFILKRIFSRMSG